MPALRRAAVFVAQVALLLVLLEGAASWLVSAVETRERALRPLAERLHVAYDPELGWVSRPNARLDDLYGPGVFLRTNSRGFRGAVETPKAVPAGRRRIVCSGDSFTLGYGVDDNQAWCARLAAQLPGVDTVNLGQGGYGIDQAYLWYRRESPQLDHDVHVFAFIAEDFLRMEVDRFMGYGKPVLVLAPGGGFEVTNVPVPENATWAPGLWRSVQGLRELRLVQLYETFVGRPLDLESRPLPEQDTAALALRVFEELARHNTEKGSTLVLVWLPMESELSPMPGDAAREGLRLELARRGIAYLDLHREFRALPKGQAAQLFLARGSTRFAAAEGHYSVEGNAFVAQLLREKLLAFPEVAARLPRAAP